MRHFDYAGSRDGCWPNSGVPMALDKRIDGAIKQGGTFEQLFRGPFGNDLRGGAQTGHLWHDQLARPALVY